MNKNARAILRFFTLAIAGAALGALGGLLSYANAADADVHDGRFMSVLFLGVVAGAVGGYFWGRRVPDEDSEAARSQAAASLLSKYRRDPQGGGADLEAGHYSISDAYLKKLLGRR